MRRVPRDTPGFRSRYGKSYLCPNPDLEPAAWVDFMRNLSGELRSKPVIIAAADIFVEAIGRRDYPAVQGGLLMTASVIIGVNLLVDLLYGVINPRIRHH